MKYLKQFGVIMLFTFAGEVLHSVLPLPVPASIYGMILLFLALLFHMVKKEQVEETGKFLIVIMPIMFIPAGVGVMEAWDLLKNIWIQLIVVMMISTIIVMVVSGRVTQRIIKMEEKKKRNE